MYALIDTTGNYLGKRGTDRTNDIKNARLYKTWQTANKACERLGNGWKFFDTETDMEEVITPSDNDTFDYFRHEHQVEGYSFYTRQHIASPFPSHERYLVERVTKAEYDYWMSKQVV